jgi:hypothetical protein
VKTIGAQKPSRQIGISARLAAATVNIGRVRRIVTSRTASAGPHASRRCSSICRISDHRIADQNADQREDFENGDKIHRRTAGKDGGDRADETARGHCQDQEQSLKTLQLDHQDRGPRKASAGRRPRSGMRQYLYPSLKASVKRRGES